MAKYTPSYLDISGFNKALSDQLYRNAQINLRREQFVENSNNQFLKTYLGKVRDQDRVKFNQYFDDYKLAAKGFMNYNRSGTAGPELSNTAHSKDVAYKNMMTFAENSMKLGETQSNLGKMKSSVRDRDKYWNLMTDLSGLDTDQVIEKYGGLDKIPTDFRFNEKVFNKKGFDSYIATQLPKPGSNPEKWKPELNADGSQKYLEETLVMKDKKGKDVNVSYQVPLKRYNHAINPMGIRAAVYNSATADTYARDYLDQVKDDTFAMAQNQDANLAGEYRGIIDYTKSLFGLKEDKDVGGEEIYAARLYKLSNLGDIVVPDYDKLDQIASIYKQQTGMELDAERLKAIKESGSSSDNSSNIRALSSALTLLEKSIDLGIFDLDGTGDYLMNTLNDAFKGLNLNRNTTMQLVKKRNEIRQKTLAEGLR